MAAKTGSKWLEFSQSGCVAIPSKSTSLASVASVGRIAASKTAVLPGNIDAGQHIDIDKVVVVLHVMRHVEVDALHAERENAPKLLMEP